MTPIRKQWRTATRKYRTAHPDKIRTYKQRQHEARPEYFTVANHRRIIFNLKDKNHRFYHNMPFFTKWDPAKGGSTGAGEKWILKHLGRRPSKRYHLHIINRRLGFIPGNLAWVPLDKHQKEELIPKLLLEIQKLRAEIQMLRKPQ